MTLTFTAPPVDFTTLTEGSSNRVGNYLEDLVFQGRARVLGGVTTNDTRTSPPAVTSISGASAPCPVSRPTDLHPAPGMNLNHHHPVGGAPAPSRVAGCALASGVGVRTRPGEISYALVPHGFSARARKTTPGGGCAPRSAELQFGALVPSLFHYGAPTPAAGARRACAPRLSANGAVPFQPGATPQGELVGWVLGLKARPIVSPEERSPSALDRPFSAHKKLALPSWGVAPGW